MIAILTLAVGLWLLGRVFGVSITARIGVLAVLLIAVMVVHLTLPEDAPLRVASGGSVRNWLIVLGVGAIAGIYAWGLRRLRRRQPDTEEAVPADGRLSDTELDRYARHIVLRELGGPGQRKLKSARVLVIGAGGLGSPAMLYLAAAGVGTLGVIDDDAVSLSNLQRQVLHKDARTGMPKVFSAAAELNALNPHVLMRPYHRRLTPEIAADLFSDYDLILDGSDNFDTRVLVNATCVALGLPLISGAIAQWEGQLGLYDPARGGPCYACVFPKATAPGLAPACAEAGVVGALPGVIGSMMALEAIKLITGAGQPLRGRLLLYDGLYGENRTIAVARRQDCPVCARPGSSGGTPAPHSGPEVMPTG